MTPDDYQAYTEQLRRNLETIHGVLGLVALGSMAAQDYPPDEWSDHDFFVIVESDQQDHFRQNLDWLPAADLIVLAYQETAHGLKVLYEHGHLLEFAVFDAQELHLAKVNRYRVLLDSGGIAAALAQIEQTSAQESQDDTFYIGQFLAHLWVGVGRYARGEKLSGTVFIKHYAVEDLLALLSRHVDAPHHALLDNLDPLRRFEAVYPALGAEINAILMQEPIVAARELLALCEVQMTERLADFPQTAVEVIRQHIEKAVAQSR